ncbi:MAG TPA: hypothetical protein VF701_10790 [Thermoanaerobaculia bacterium]
MACDHIGGPELIELAEAHLRREGIAEETWEGLRFRWSENPAEGGMWASIVIEIERREGQWTVTRIDRNREPVGEVGFRALGRG